MTPQPPTSAPGHADPPAAHAIWTHLAELILRVDELEAKVETLEARLDD